ncbi:hypothetical protein BCV70DRAFT_224763 [Testicularia cyperi]|uniref:Uncharacterized protein n=1 Tax=Testicularia cyperi TaxID=1882483 RepID=A0A317XZ93_9BASI|nr:hypothetical protein BCV70DRAFT_224763 [Testicularia cyperi]
MDLQTDDEGWIGGGASESMYANKHTPPPKDPTTPDGRKSHGNGNGNGSGNGNGAAGSSLLERMGMSEHLQTPPPKSRDSSDRLQTSTASSSPTSPFKTTPTSGIRRPGVKLPAPLPLTSPARNNGPISPNNTRTPLSASHPIPETPLKLSQRGGPQTPATPHYPLYPNHTPAHDGDASRASGLGLGLTPLKTPIPLANPDGARSPLNEPLHLRGRASSNASLTGFAAGSPLKSGRNDLQGGSLGLGSYSGMGNRSRSDSTEGGNQIDSMLERLRNARSGLGTSASIWAPKTADSTTETASSNAAAPTMSASSSSSSINGMTHTFGSGFNTGNMLGVQTGADRKRPTHRHNGLQLSLGQEINVMQNLDEQAEDELPSSSKSTAGLGDRFRIDPPLEDPEGEQDGWQGHVVPPTPSLGCDSSASSDEADGANKSGAGGKRSHTGFVGWGSSAGVDTRKSSLFSGLPSASELEANWSGDDDDEKRDDDQVFQQIQRAAKASSKNRTAASSAASNSAGGPSFSPLPPPPINYRSRTPSPTHGLLAVSPRLDSDREPRNRTASSSSSIGGLVLGVAAPVKESNSRASSARYSPASNRSLLPSDESDADADAETDRPKRGKERTSKSKPVAPAPASSVLGTIAAATQPGLETTEVAVSASSQATEGLHPPTGLEKKRSLKRDKSERIRGRRSSQSKDKDKETDKIRMSVLADAPASAIVKTGEIHPSSDLSEHVAKISLKDAARTSPQPKTAALEEHQDDSKTSTPAKETSNLPPATPSAGTVQSIPTAKDDLFSSPAEPKVELPAIKPPSPAKSSGEEQSILPAGEKNDEPTLKPKPSIASFDWAADDDELGDELPDLDDWGITLTPSKPPAPTLANKSSGVVAGSAALQVPGKKGRNGHGVADKGEDRGPGGGAWRSVSAGSRAKDPNGSSGLHPPAAAEGGAPLGIRIAGRAREASAEPLIKPGEKVAPARTPYGRWNKQADDSSSTGPAGKDDKFLPKGKGNRKAPDSRSTSAANSPRETKETERFTSINDGPGPGNDRKKEKDRLKDKEKEKPSVRPRIAADLGALAALLTPAEPSHKTAAGGKAHKDKKADKSASTMASTTAKAKDPGAASEASTALANSTTSAGAGAGAGAGGAAESMHALRPPPSVADSMHAPKSNAKSPSPSPLQASADQTAGKKSSAKRSGRGSGKK